MLKPKSKNNFCRICSSEHVKPFLKVASLKIYSCSSCGFRWPELLPAKQDLERHYDNEYNDLRFFRGQQVNALINLKIIRKKVKSLRGLDILDVGAGYGLLAQLLSSKCGANCEAVEISKAQREYASNELGLTVYSDLDSVTKKYDVIVCFEVIEHIPEPLEFLSAVCGLLKHSGVIVLGTDNFNCTTVLNMGSSFPKWVPAEHLSCFGPKSLKRLFTDEDSVQLEQLETYVSWELRLASMVLYLRSLLAPLFALSGEGELKPQTELKAKKNRHYRFFRLRKFLSPFFAAISLSRDIDGEMMIVKARRI